MAKILIVEDDKQLSELIVDWLTGEKYTPEPVYDGDEGLERLKFYKYDAIVLDWELPGISGPEICNQFRKGGGQTPILMLTGKKEIEDKTTGLDAGADDYLTKPFHMQELSARLRALLRRGSVDVSRTVLTAGHVSLDPVSRKVTSQGNEITLQPREYALLEFLLRHPNQPFSAEAIMDRVWSSESDASPDTVRLQIMRLRHKIDIEGKESMVRTIHRVGYMLVPGS
ncbi:MAG: response regulator transcription factor [Cyanobacteria bacterium SZAS LIN-5]|nr:response regulator transcription factor [Cyanobacteria bacterium SZAS LIN-5]RTL40113.1 MAG: response regulator transcription factor [Candidatus Melainabacteria bacterium]